VIIASTPGKKAVHVWQFKYAFYRTGPCGRRPVRQPTAHARVLRRHPLQPGRVQGSGEPRGLRGELQVPILTNLHFGQNVFGQKVFGQKVFGQVFIHRILNKCSFKNWSQIFLKQLITKFTDLMSAKSPYYAHLHVPLIKFCPLMVQSNWMIKLTAEVCHPRFRVKGLRAGLRTPGWWPPIVTFYIFSVGIQESPLTELSIIVYLLWKICFWASRYLCTQFLLSNGTYTLY
jgi:hypothetical protein